MNQRPLPDPRLARLAGLMASRFSFLSVLGEGGSGRVYEVRNLSLDRREAMKVLSDLLLDEGASERFAHEAKIAASLDHPGIVKIHNFGREEGIHWYSMALVEGPTLAEWMDQGRQMDAATLAGMALPILEALEFSHARGVIHRDIKPANILFDLQGHPFLADFGIAKSEESALKTKTGLLLGTPAYVSPEQALGESVDARTDQYSFGITLYKALTGRLPFTSENLIQTLVLRLNEDPEPLERHRPDLGPELSRVIMRALARDRARRWDSISDMKAALSAVFGNMQLAPGPSLLAGLSPIPRSPLPDIQVTAPTRIPERGSFEPTAELTRPMPRSGRRWPLMVGGLVLIGLVGLSWGWTRKGASKQPRFEPEATGAARAAQAKPVQPGPLESAPSLPARPKDRAGASPVPAAGRPVVFPQLIEAGGPLPVALPTGCAGVHVNVSLVVTADGTVRQCKVLTPTGPECEQAAKAVALRYRFKPALDAQGKPVETTIAAAVDFPETP